MAGEAADISIKDIPVPCSDFTEFKDALKLLRDTDDRIVYRLNTIVPTASFAKSANARERCKQLYEKIEEAHRVRGAAINRCVGEVSTRLATLQSQRQENPSDERIVREIRAQQTKLRWIQNELTVEEVLREQTLKVFREKCRAYKPS